MIDDTSQQNPQQNLQQNPQQNSYVDDYVPPVTNYASPVTNYASPVMNDALPAQTTVDPGSPFSPVISVPPNPVDFSIPQEPLPTSQEPLSTPSAPLSVPPVLILEPELQVLSDADVLPPESQTASEAPTSNTDSSELLENQNIFELLGITEATEEEKELFLDELQQVIWEDFVENDVELLLTEDELKEFRVIAENTSLSEDDRQGQMIEFLENLIPDLDKIMLEKALDLKEEMTRQRIIELQQHYKDTPERLEIVQQALTLADQQQWRSVAATLNAMMTA